MDARARRIGENEALFRHVNEEIRALDRRLDVGAESTYDFLCECGRGDCTEPVELTVAEYERIHSDPTQFVAVPGHEEPSVELVTERHDGYNVLRKREGGPAELAAERAGG